MRFVFVFGSVFIACISYGGFPNVDLKVWMCYVNVAMTCLLNTPHGDDLKN